MVDDHLHGATVLVVGHDAARRASLRVHLEHAGAVVREVGTRVDALDPVHGRPDLVVVDAGQAERDDVDLVELLKSDPLTAEIPVIQRSAAATDDGAVVDRLRRGADAYLADPVSDQVIVATAAALLRTQDLARRLEVALSSGSSGVFDWNVSTGRVRWTESLERIHGMQPGEFGGTLHDFTASVHPDDRWRVDDELSQALELSETFTLAFRFLRTDGSTGHLEGRGRVFRDGRGAPTRVLGMAQDVSQRVVDRQQVEQLRRLAAQLSGLRTSAGVIAAVEEELDASNVRVALVDDADEIGRDVVYSFAAGAHRLDVQWTPLDGGTTRRQAIAIGELAGAAVDRALRYESERTNAEILQAALQPADVPEIEGYGLDAAYVPAGESDRLGGDFFDVLDLADSFVVVVGDVAGHGIDASRQMGSIRTMLRTLSAGSDGDPVAVVDRARALFDDVCGRGAPFTTVIVCRVDVRTGATTIVSAGHPPAATGRPGSAPELLTMRPTPPLGVHAGAATVPGRTTIGPGEWLAVYTDGVFERRDVPIDDAIATAMATVEGVPTAHQILAAGESYADLTTDDRAVVVVRRRSADPSTAIGDDGPERADQR